jgi:hypothetical protein
MASDDLGHVFQRYARIPDVVWINKNDGAFLMASGAGVAEHEGGGNATPIHFLPESFE